MKKLTRIFALVLALLMLTALFSACGSTASTPPAGASSVPAAPTTPDGPAEIEPEAEPEPEGDAALPLAPELTTLTMMNKALSVSNNALPYAESAAGALFWEDIEGLTNVALEWIEVNNDVYGQQLGVYAASGDMPDMVSCGVGPFYPGGNVGAYDNGLIYPLSDYLDCVPNYVAYIAQDEQFQKDAYTDEGQMLAFRRYTPNAYNKFGVVMRQDWLDELNLEKPQTVSEFHDALAAIRTAYDTSDTFQISNNNQLKSFIAGAYGTPGYDLSPINTPHNHIYHDGDVVKSSLTQDGYRDYLAEMNKWYDEGIISTNFVNPVDHVIIFLASDNKSNILTGQTAAFYLQPDALYDFVGAAEDPNFALTGLSYLPLEKGETTHFTEVSYSAENYTTVVTTSCETPELAFRYLDFWYSDTGYQYSNLGAEGVSFNYVDGGYEFTDAVLNNEWGASIFHARAAFALCGGNYGWGIEDAGFALDTTTAEQREVFVSINENSDNACIMPFSLAMTAEESSSVALALADIETYASECASKFITGEMSTETDWAEYVKTIEDIGIAAVVATYQAAYDRYKVR